MESAWSVRSGGATYAVRRLLWFRVLFAALEGADLSMSLGQLKAELCGPPAGMEWAMGPLLAHVEPRLDRPTYHLLTRLTQVLSGQTPVEELDGVEMWGECAAAPAE